MKFISHLGLYHERIDKVVKKRIADHTVKRLWEKDHTLWKPDPSEIVNRLGWLDIAERMRKNLSEIEKVKTSLVGEGYTHALLLGMGGSSLAPEVFRKTFGFGKSDLNVDILDSTDPDSVRVFSENLNPETTLFIVSTKSGGTVETLSFFKYFYNWIQKHQGKDAAGRHFIAITDPGSSLERLSEKYRFRHTFLNDPDIGGRFSALSCFGLVPAVFLGISVDEIIQSAEEITDLSKNPDNTGLRLGVILGEMALAGRDKVIFMPSKELDSFGDWAEQLIAESTGKEGKGILPVVGEFLFKAGQYSHDRLFVFQSVKGNCPNEKLKMELIEAGHPVLEIEIQDLTEIGGLFYLWEMATAVACISLRINPFDQPNVESAKVRAREMAASYIKTGHLPREDSADFNTETLKSFLKSVSSGDYITLQIYAQSGREKDRALSDFRRVLTNRYGVTTTAGYGPRFLHSTGQLHKGDGGNGYFIQIVMENEEDIPIPDEAGDTASSMTFSFLKQSQALGDKQALNDAGRSVLHFHLNGDLVKQINELIELWEG